MDPVFRTIDSQQILNVNELHSRTVPIDQSCQAIAALTFALVATDIERYDTRRADLAQRHPANGLVGVPNGGPY